MNAFAIVCAAMFGLSALILDAIGAHALKHWLPSGSDVNQVVASWQNATRVQTVHALFLMGLVALLDRLHPFFFKASVLLTVVGVLFFSGSIYVKHLCALESVTRIAPYGGVMLMLAWVCLAIGFLLPRN